MVRFRLNVFLSLALFLTLPGLQAQPALLGEWPTTLRGGEAQSVVVQASRNLAFVAAGEAGLMVVDVSDRSRPQLRSRFDTAGFARAVAVQDGRAYVADSENGLVILDVSNATAPVLLGTHDTAGMAEDVKLSGTRAYVADGVRGWLVVDVSNPGAPQRVSTTPGLGRAGGIEVAGGWVYVAEGDAGLQVYSAATAARAGGLDTSGFAAAVSLQGTVAVVADGAGGLKLIGVGTPALPVLLGSLPTARPAVGVHVLNGIAAVALGDSGCQLVNVSTPAAPVGLATIVTRGGMQGAHLVGTALHVADLHSGLRIYGVGTPGAPVLEGSLGWGGESAAVKIAGNRGYVADWSGGLVVLDVTNPQFPRAIGGYGAGGAVTDVEVAGARAYVTDYWEGLSVLDISNPLAPVRLGGVALARASDIHLAGTRAYVGHASGFDIFDVSTANPVRLGGFAADGAVYRLTVVGTSVYLAVHDTVTRPGFQVVGVGNPAAPAYLGGFQTGEPIFGVTVIPTRAYVATAEGGVQILSVGNPAGMVRVGSFPPGSGAHGLEVAGTTAFVAGGLQGLGVYNVANAAAVTRTTGRDTRGVAMSSTLSGLLAYVADGPGGVSVLTQTTPVNAPPSFAAIADATLPEGVLYQRTLSATDSQTPAGSLVYSLIEGPSGLSVTAAGQLSWLPSASQGPGTYRVTVQVMDNGTPPMGDVESFQLTVTDGAPVALRTVWQIGTDEAPTATPHGEFSSENGRNDAAPGGVTRLPGDPQFTAAGNPGADDDFYFAGVYPAGFNGLTAALSVPNDEPSTAWERAHTHTDHTNRLHFVLAAEQVASGTPYRLRLELPRGASTLNGVAQPGIGLHDLVVRFRNGSGVVTPLAARQITQSAEIVVEFTAGMVAATAGPNSIEVVRTGPLGANVTGYILYDFLRLEALEGSNTPPVLAPVANRTVDELAPMAISLEATDAESPPQTLTFALVSGPSGLQVLPNGTLTWTPTEAQGPGVHPVTVRVTDSGTPALSDTRLFSITVREVPELLARTVWQIGSNDNPAVAPYAPSAEFSFETGVNDPAPGRVTRLAGDPVYDANPAANPGADDDFYFAGEYPPGFNGLAETLFVPADEPPAAWERAHSHTDLANRLHFVLTPSQVAADSGFRLRIEFATGGTLINGVPQTGFGPHDIEVHFRNGAGTVTPLMTQTVTQATEMMVEFTAGAVGATPGANTLEILRPGPRGPGIAAWLLYDYLRLEVLSPNAPPSLTPPADRVVEELALLSLTLQATDPDPQQTLSFALVDGPAGMGVTTAGLLTWVPTEAQGPGVYTVTVRVTDNGAPAASDTQQFTVTVNEVPDPVARSVWQIGTDHLPGVAPYAPSGEFSIESGRNEAAPGGVTRLPGDPQYAADANPAADDDFYFAGAYPAGFNGLAAALSVPNDEPPLAWERAHSHTDLANRLHFLLAPDQIGAGRGFRLRMEFTSGGTVIGGVTQPGIGIHDMEVRFRNGSGVVTPLLARRVTTLGELALDFTATAVGATAGANTIEVVRTGPVGAGVTGWILYDYLRLEALDAVNTAPVLTTPGDRTVDELDSLALQLQATDTDLPVQSLTYSLVSGPTGLQVSGAGALTWTPTEAQGPGAYLVTVRVTDSGAPALSDTRQFTVTVNEVPDPTPVARTVWQIGTDEPPTATPHAEFSVENGRNDAAPGLVTRLPGDPQYSATGNPGADDDFYFTGAYPAGFNGLAAALSVPNDEPSAAWERAHSHLDRTNRIHFVLTAEQVAIGASYRLRLDLPRGASAINGVAQPGIGVHDLVVGFRNGAGVLTPLATRQLTQATDLVLEFTAGMVGATAGPNSIEVVRTGPIGTGITGFILYDFLRLEALEVSNTPPSLAAVADRTVDELGSLALQLQATDTDLPAQSLTYSLVSGPTGLQVSGAGVLTWTPTEAQGPGAYLVTVRVTDSGTPALSGTRQFTVTVNEVPDPTPVARTVWQIGSDDNPAVLPYNPHGEFTTQNGRNDPAPGAVTRVPGDPAYDADPEANPVADDDFYFAGQYPSGFNSLPAALSVPFDEPPIAWERGHTAGDRFMRAHWNLSAGHLVAGARFRLSLEFATGGFSLGGVTQPGFGTHDMEIWFRNGNGGSTPLRVETMTGPTEVVLEFSAASVGATLGANTLEIIRTGPTAPGMAIWIRYDYLRLEWLPPATAGGSSGVALTGGATARSGFAVFAAGTPGPGSLQGAARIVGGLTFATLSYDLPDPAPETVRPRVEVSRDLVRWTEAEVVVLSDEVRDGRRWLTVQDSVPAEAGGPRYLRLRLIPGADSAAY